MSLIRESSLPGVGKKFQINTRSGDKMVVIIHDDGTREIHHFFHDDPEESISMVTLDDDEARRVSAIIGGMVYRPQALETADVAFDKMVIEWYKVEPGDMSIDKEIGELNVRKTTGATIIAIVQRDQEKIINPGPETIIKAGATLVILGNREQVKGCKKLIKSGSQ